MGKYAIAIDLGATHLRVAVIDATGILREKSVGSTSGKPSNQIIEDIAACVSELKSRWGIEHLAGIGIGVTGFLVLNQGLLILSPNLPGFENFPILSKLESALGTQVLLENDANAAALGERWVGAGVGLDDLVLISIGTGLGAGIIINGEILHGFAGLAGEVGHMTLYPDDSLCTCGNVGCLENYASGRAIATIAKLTDLGDLTSKDVLKLAKAGNERAQSVFSTMGKSLGIGIASLVNIFNSPLYLLSGGPVSAWDFFAPAMFEEISKRSLVFRTTNTVVKKAQLGEDSCLYGAAYLVFKTQPKLNV